MFHSYLSAENLTDRDSLLTGVQCHQWRIWFC